jgi:hypothetical protein
MSRGFIRGDGSGAPTMTLGDRGLHGVKRDVESVGPLIAGYTRLRTFTAQFLEALHMPVAIAPRPTPRLATAESSCSLSGTEQPAEASSSCWFAVHYLVREGNSSWHRTRGGACGIYTVMHQLPMP